MRDAHEMLMRFGVVGFCRDCGDDMLLVPVDDDGGDHCCTGCDAAVVLVPGAAPRLRGDAQRRAG